MIWLKEGGYRQGVVGWEGCKWGRVNSLQKKNLRNAGAVSVNNLPINYIQKRH